MDRTSEIFIERTKKLLKQNGLKQKDLASYTGYKDSGISTLFKKGNQSFDLLKKTALMLGTTTDHLLGLTDNVIERTALRVIPWDRLPQLNSHSASELAESHAIYYGEDEDLDIDSAFCIRVQDSYAEPEYYENDIVMIEPMNEVPSNELALVYIPKLNQSVICFAKKGFLSYALIPKNEAFSKGKIELKSDELIFLGRCKDILREEV